MSNSQILLFSQPRTGCHLLERILTSKQDNARLLAHPAQLSVQPLTKWTESDSFLDGMPDDILVEYKDHVEQGSIIWEETLQTTKEEVCIDLKVLLVIQYHPADLNLNIPGQDSFHAYASLLYSFTRPPTRFRHYPRSTSNRRSQNIPRPGESSPSPRHYTVVHGPSSNSLRAIRVPRP